MSSPFTITHELNVLQPAVEPHFPVSRREWDALRDRIEAIKPRRQIFENIGSILGGASLTAFIGLMSGVPIDAQPKAQLVAWVVFIAGGITGIAMFACSHQLQKREGGEALEAVRLMGMIEGKYPREEVEAPSDKQKVRFSRIFVHGREFLGPNRADDGR